VAPDPAASGGQPDAGSVRAAAHAILSQPQFRQTPESPIDRFRHWVGQQIAHALSGALSGRVTVIGAVALVAIAALVAWLVVRVSRRVQLDRAVGGVVVGSGAMPPAEWLRMALACEQRGDWRGALRARYRALVGELTRRGLATDIAGRTTGEYRDEVRVSLPGTSEDFGVATELFEHAVYGAEPTGPDESRRIQQLADRVLEAAR
jgi:hypothetical protein